MIVSFQNPEQKLTEFENFWNSRTEFSNSREFPNGGPDPGAPHSDPALWASDTIARNYLN